MSRAEADPGERRTFRLLYVCTGNICRSAFAEIFTRHLLAERLDGETAAGFVIASAGAQAVIGAEVHPAIRDELRRRGVADVLAESFIARQLTPRTIDGSDLVLGAEPAHRSAAVACRPAALPVAFALREFANLTTAVDPATLAHGPVARARALVEEAHRLRGLLPREPSSAHRLPDPMGGPATAFREAAAQVAHVVTRIVDLVTLHEPPGIDART